MEFPLTYAQQQIWLDQIFRPDDPAYNIGGYLRVPHRLDLGRLQVTLDRIAEKETSLRSTVRSSGGQFFQAVAATTDGLADYRDLSALSDARGRAAGWFKAELQKPFDLEGARGLAAAFIASIVPEEFWICLKVHHVFLDYQGFRSVFSQILEDYVCGDHDKPVAAGETALSAAHGVHEAECRYEASSAYERDLAYWRGRLAKASRDQTAGEIQAGAVHLGGSRRRPGVRKNGQFRTRIDPEVFSAFSRRARDLNSTAFRLLLVFVGAYGALERGNPEELVGISIAGRKKHQSNGPATCLARVIPVTFNWRPRSDVATLLSELDADLRRDLLHSQAPLSRHIRDFTGGRLTSPVPRILLNYIRNDHVVAGEFRAKIVPLSFGSVSELSVHVLDEGADGAEVIIDYDRRRTSGRLISRLQRAFSAFVSGFARPEGGAARVVDLFRDGLTEEEQRGWLIEQSQKLYWGERLSGVPAGLDLSMDRERGAARSERGVAKVELAGELTASLEALCRQCDVTVQAVLLTGWAIVLSRLSGHEDLVIGSIATDRMSADAAAGGVLPIRIDLSDLPDVRTLLNRVGTALAEAEEHKDFALRELADATSSSNHAWPRIEAAIAWLDDRDPSFMPARLEAEPGAGGLWIPQDCISLILAGTGEGIGGGLVYPTALFEPRTAERYARHLGQALAQMALYPDQTPDSLALLSPGEIREVLAASAGTEAPFPRALCVHELFEVRVRSEPDATALIFGDHRLSYRELNARANQLAHHLRALGVGPEVPVALCVGRSPDLIVGMLAVFKAGGAYVPLDPGYPAERLRFMLEDSAPELALTNETAARTLSAAVEGLPRPVPILDMTADSGRWRMSPKEDPPPGAVGLTARNLAYVIYTSGSSGRPKGVLVEHAQLVATLSDMVERLSLGPSDVFPNLASSSFDISLLELLSPLIAGASTALVDAHHVLDLRSLIDETQSATCFHAVSSLMELWCNEMDDADDTSFYPRLRNILVGGEPVSNRLIERLRARFDRADIFVMYGPTEAAIICASLSLRDRVGSPPLYCIGRPISNTRIYVLDRRGAPVPVGAVGEIYIGGDGVSRGYLNRPELTAERFVQSPFRDEERLYRTGDLGRYLPGQDIQFMGRADLQVKIRGFRIEPGEIEARLASCEGVREAAVLVRADQLGEKQLIAYYVTAKGADPDIGHLRRHVSSALPDYMVPAAYVRLERLPVTPSGKLDREALPAPADEAYRDQAYEAPLGPTETALADIWSKLLHVGRIGRRDSFVQLGGHSLLAVRAAAAIRQRLGRDLSIQAIFDATSLAELADLLEQSGATVEGPPLARAPQAGHAPFPLTPVQQAYWLGRQGFADLGQVACHLYTEFQFRHIDVDRLTQAWRTAIDRHPMLRMIVDPDGQQRILRETPPFAISFVDCSDRPKGEADEIVRSLRAAMSREVRPTDRWPILDVRVTRVACEDWRLHLNMDGVVLDDVSANLLMTEVFDRYRGRRLPGPPPAVTFRDYVMHLQGRDTSAAAAYWEERIRTLPTGPALPLAVSPSSLANPHFSRQSARLKPDVWALLKSRAAAAGLTPSGVLLTAYAEVLGTWARSDDFTLNVTFDDRPEHPDIASVLGVFTNLIPLEIRGACRGAFRQRAVAQQRQLAADLDHRAISGVDIQRMMAQHVGGSKGGLLPVVFTSVIGVPRPELPDEAIGIAHSITETPQTSLDNKVYDIDGGLGIDWDAPETLFPPGLLSSMFNAYVDLLNALAGSESAWTRTRRSLLPATERQLFRKANATAGPLPEDLLHDAFFVAAEQTPTAPAIIDEDRTLSYREIEHRILDLAHRLRAALDPADRLVAVVMEKGFEQVVAVLAVLETGRAFLPISAGQPDQRIKAILAQAECRVALTQARIRRGCAWQDQVMLINVPTDPPAGPIPPRQRRTASADDLAYVIYTSGSTGAPKGVAIQHRAARNTLVDMIRRTSLKPDDRVLWVSSLEFDLSIFDLFGLLAAGGAIVIPAPDGARNPLGWARSVYRHRVTVWNSVPAIAELLLSGAGPDAAKLLASLRLILLSGDWIPLTLPARLRGQIAQSRIISLGGATEASIWSIFHEIEEIEPHWASIPYGKPLANQSFHVLRSDFSPCPVHTVGKLFIGGAGLALGYWNDPQQTQARFVSHPKTGERLYDTGDLGRYRPDGSIEFLGREDHQIKLRGFRIELGEIEAALLAHPGVRDAVAVIEREPTERLTAFVVPSYVAEGADRPPKDGLIVAPLERAAFTLKQSRRRPAGAENGESVGLPGGVFDELRTQTFLARQSYRAFSRRVISLSQFGGWISCLQAMPVQDAAIGKRLYPSAGSLYPVQIHMIIKAGAVEGLEAGPYVYDPLRHDLTRLHGPGLEALGMEAGALGEEASLAVFFVGHLPAIQPLYGDWSREACLLEAGYMGQLLSQAGPVLGIGACAIGNFDEAPLRRCLDLPDVSDVILHGLLAGPVERDQQRQWRPMQLGEQPKALSAKELRQWLLGRLPDYMVPSALMLIDALPLTANGKVDRGALRAASSQADEAKVYAPPAGPVETTLAAIWSDLLGVSRIGRDDNFFELGGHSLLAVRALERMRRAGLKAEVASLFGAPTLREFSTHVQEIGSLVL